MENIIEKIKKLIRHQESAEKIGSLNEANAFASKIQKMLNEHNLSMKDITIEELEEKIIQDFMSCRVPSVSKTLGYFVMYPIAKYNYCRIYLAGDNMCIVGTKENIEVCKYIYDFCLNNFVRIGKDEFKKENPQIGLDTYLRTFLQGAASGLELKFKNERKLQEIENLIESGVSMSQVENSTSSLTLVIQKNDKAVANYVENNMSTKKGRSKSIKKDSTYFKGVQAGQNIKINKVIS